MSPETRRGMKLGFAIVALGLVALAVLWERDMRETPRRTLFARPAPGSPGTRLRAEST